VTLVRLCSAQHSRVVRIAPRYDERIIMAALELDDRDEPIAEICRRVAAHAQEHGITRPSYVHLRRLIRAERERRDEELARRRELMRIAADVYEDTIRARVVDAFEVAERVREAGR